jgi:hypothetical protein
MKNVATFYNHQQPLYGARLNGRATSYKGARCPKPAMKVARQKGKYDKRRRFGIVKKCTNGKRTIKNQ